MFALYDWLNHLSYVWTVCGNSNTDLLLAIALRGLLLSSSFMMFSNPLCTFVVDSCFSEGRKEDLVRIITSNGGEISDDVKKVIIHSLLHQHHSATTSSILFSSFFSLLFFSNICYFRLLILLLHISIRKSCISFDFLSCLLNVQLLMHNS